MHALSLRLRVFLFFGLLGLGGLCVVLGGLWLGYRQLDNPAALSAFVTVGIVSTFGLLALAVFVWRLFDENLSKPLEHLAAQFRIQTDAGVDVEIDPKVARYLGDLAPAAIAIHQKLGAATQKTAESVAQKTMRLEQHRAQLLEVLSDIPVAVIVVTQNHQVVLYDGQAADLMEREAPARLNSSVFDYLDEASVRDALAKMQTDAVQRRAVVVKACSGALYSGYIRRFDGEAGYTLMLEALDPDAARPLVYDFDLLNKPPAANLGQTALRALTFVVFDSETTGLDPDQDEVIQLGAVRVVNGKIIRTETFDTFVNPGRSIPASSTKVHGICDEMVLNAPTFPDACAQFHAFARDAVIIAHNAPFDLAFLHRYADVSGVIFDHPVLDTVHLSAIVFGGSAEHTLDAICDRLGVEIAADVRHTALGDAMATAQVFVTLLPILEARGLQTLEKLRVEMQKHSRILKVEGP